MKFARYVAYNPEPEIVLVESPESWADLKRLLHQTVDAELLKVYGPTTEEQQTDALKEMLGL